MDIELSRANPVHRPWKANPKKGFSKREVDIRDNPPLVCVPPPKPILPVKSGGGGLPPSMPDIFIVNHYPGSCIRHLPRLEKQV
ncbi:hypothetical protein ACFL7M_18980 [Thermodesulfobacteriota bacterium]